MKHIIFTIALLGLLTGVSFAQRGRMDTGAGRGVGQMGSISHTNPGTPRYGPTAIQPAGRQMPPIVGRTAKSPSSPATGSTNSTVGNDQRKVAPPDAAVGPNVSDRKLQN